MVSMKTVGDLFNEHELERTVELWRGDRDVFRSRVQAEVIEPAMPRINAETGQENDPAFLAYVLEYALLSSSALN